eukprot:gnl/MRDRNA2_/MRDRNA2_27120_c0_seq1.p1 gnl/MRDRNA2_/MRDRNA2_27120_c0~~gnl/MRDRNA2_/MRDRNA2_27120_c0_seq1.p1  ORF type:complete len:203 (-),score=22.04 gnl/MRDRNA2_/MRDRNA2_27120_c0_seq1:239-847(-)
MQDSQQQVEQSHGVWSFKMGPTSMTYEGSFIVCQQERLKHGTGVMRWEDGREYRGQFAYDDMYGEGTMSWPTGATYVGQYCDNLKSGIGKLTLPDGSSYMGSWYQGMLHGKILYLDSQGRAFRREYVFDKCHKSESITSFDGWTLKIGYEVFTQTVTRPDVESSESKDFTCCVCLDEMCHGDTCCKLPCNHVFHKECIDRYH